MPSKAKVGDLRMPKKGLDDKIVKRVDKFLFRLQSQILSGLLPELKKLVNVEGICQLPEFLAETEKEVQSWNQQ
jgi:hypothetical protein